MGFYATPKLSFGRGGRAQRSRETVPDDRSRDVEAPGLSSFLSTNKPRVGDNDNDNDDDVLTRLLPEKLPMSLDPGMYRVGQKKVSCCTVIDISKDRQ